MSILIGISIYLVIGVIALCVFDCITKRLRRKLTIATAETQNSMAASGTPVGNRTAAVLLVGAIWLFWPVMFIGVLTDKKEGVNGEKG